MATTYRATRRLRCWKRHECVGCGCVYRYRFERKLEATGASDAAAEQGLRRKLDEAVRRDVDVCPCPDCGLAQPDMVAKYRWRAHLLVAGGAAVGLLAVAAGGWVLGHPRWVTAVISLVLALAAAAAHLGFLAVGPNRDPRANKAAAKQLADDGKLEVVEHGRSRAAARRGPAVGGGELALVAAHALPVLLLGATAFAPDPGRGDVPDVVERRGRLGSTIRVEVGSVLCFDGRWRGDATATVTNPGDFPGGPPAVRASSQEDRWPRDYMARSTTESHRKVWVDLALPEGDQYDGKTVELDVAVRATYPVVDDSRTEMRITRRGPRHNITCRDETTTIRRPVRVRLTSSVLPSLGTGAAVATGGLLLGLLGTAGLGGVLALRGRALATDAIPPKVEYDKAKPDRGGDDPRRQDD